MKLKEYMEMYERSVLNKIEAQAFGLPDMKKGWPKRYADLEVSEEMLKHIIDSPSCTKSNRKLRKKILKKVVYTKSYETTDEKYLYLMRNANGLMKIGISVDPVKRARQISTASGINVFLLCAWKVDKNTRKVEAHLHKRFDRHRLEGEWFKPNSISVLDVEGKMDCGFERVYEQEISSVAKYDREFDAIVYDSIVCQTEKAILFSVAGEQKWCPKSRVFHHNFETKEIKIPKGQWT